MNSLKALPAWLLVMILLISTSPLLFPQKDRWETRLEKWAHQGRFERAEKYCDRKGPDVRSRCYRLLADICLAGEAYERARQYCREAGYQEGFERIAEFYRSAGDYEQAAACYGQAGSSERRAQFYGFLGDYYKERGEQNRAKQYYQEAVQEYESLIKRSSFSWDLEANSDRLRCLQEIKKLPQTPQEQARQAQLEDILAHTAGYCRQLENSAIKFYCLEEMRERLDRSREGVLGTPTGIFKTTYLYDYQLVKEGNDIKETRKLLEVNGRDVAGKNERAETQFQVEKVLFGPVGKLSREWQRFYTYRLLREDLLKGAKALVFETIPRQRPEKNLLFGRIWVKADDYSILKIQWNPRSIGNYRAIEQTARTFDETPQMTVIYEFGIEQGGIRFPSRCYIEEAYVDQRGKKFARTQLEILYKNHQFFNVGIEKITYQNTP
jgi:tetratricopeptide (TPR) repeat protein